MSRSEPVDPTASPWHLLGAAMRHWREDVRGLSLRDVAAKNYVDPGDLSKWERGLARPQADTVSRIDAHLAANNQLVALHTAIYDLDRLRRRVTLRDRTPTQDEDDVERRTLLHLLSAFGATAALPPGTVDTVFAGVKRSLDDRLENDLDDWEQTAWEYAQSIWIESPGALIPDLAADLLQIGRLLDRDLPGPVRDGLMRVSAQLGVYMAMELSDTGNQRASWRSWRSARRAADVSGDLRLAVWVRGREASDAFWDGRPAGVVDELLNQAIRLANGRPYKGLATALETQARHLVTQGNATEALTAIDNLNDLFERLPANVTTDHISTFGVPEELLWFTRSYVYAHLGDSRQACAAADRALALCPPEKKGGRANMNLLQSLALVRDHDIRDGLNHALASVDGVPMTSSRRHILDRIIQSLPEQVHAQPAAHHLRALKST